MQSEALGGNERSPRFPRSQQFLGPIALAVLSLLPLLAFPAHADDVHLANGKVFRGVVAEEVDGHVRIRMPGGEMSLPKSQVREIVQSESGYPEYLRRKQELARSSSAQDWLALALFARGEGLNHGTREAALRAAELDPTLPGLVPIFKRLGYVFDAEQVEWIPANEAMRRRGFVQDGTEWITKTELVERSAKRQAEREKQLAELQARNAEAREQRIAAALTLAAQAQAAGASRPPVVVQIQVPSYIGFPYYTVPVVSGPPQREEHRDQPLPPPGSLAPAQPQGSSRMTRTPGSILPDDGR